jgi:biotin carboxyl carrier protein
MKDYMKALAAHQKGDVVKVKVKRGDTVKTLEATF